MKKIVLSSLICVSLFLSLIPGLAMASGTSECKAVNGAGSSGGALLVRASGSFLDSGSYVLALETGRFVDRAVRVYSEPSHTLLLLAADPKFSNSAEGIQW